MAQREVKQWITVKGRHIPIFEGETKEDAIKRATKAKGATPISKDDEVKDAHPEAKKSLDKNLKNAQDRVDMLKEELKKHPNDQHTAEIKERLRKAKADYKRLSNGDNSSTEHFKTAKEWDKENTMKNRNALKKEIDDYVKAHPNPTAADKKKVSEMRDKYNAMKKEAYEPSKQAQKEKEAEIKASKEKVSKQKPMSPEEKKKAHKMIDEAWNAHKGPKNQISKDADEKEKQISQHKAEADKLNGKKSGSEKSGADAINEITKRRQNGGGTGDDWKKVRDHLEQAPAGTVMTQTGDRGVKFQYTKGEDGKWHNDQTSTAQDSKTVSMGWTGTGRGYQVEFSKKGLTKEQLKESQDRAVSGKLNQQLGLDKNGNKIGTRMSPKVESKSESKVSEKSDAKSTLEKDFGGILHEEVRKSGKTTVDSKNAYTKDEAYKVAADTQKKLRDMGYKDAKAEAYWSQFSDDGKEMRVAATYGKKSESAKTSDASGGEAKLDKYKASLANASNKASYLSWLVRSGKITEAEREALRATYKKPKSETQKQISKDFDTKEKQIAQHKAEADRLNSKSSSNSGSGFKFRELPQGSSREDKAQRFRLLQKDILGAGERGGWEDVGHLNGQVEKLYKEKKMSKSDYEKLSKNVAQAQRQLKLRNQKTQA